MDYPELTQQEAVKAWEYWYPLVYGYFFRRLNNQADVEELTANTVTALLLSKQVLNPRAFIWQTARNQLVEFIKQKTKNQTVIELQEYSAFSLPSWQNQDFTPSSNSSSNYTNKLSELKECIQNQLKGQDYQIVSLSILENQNSSQIGQKLGIKPNTVRQKLKRAINKIRQKCLEIWQQNN